MDQKQADRMEEMLSNLITIVGSMNQRLLAVQEEQQSMKEEMQSMKEDIQSVKNEQKSMKSEQQSMRGEIAEIKEILLDMKADQDHIWEKAVRNERELAIIKRHFQD